MYTFCHRRSCDENISTVRREICHDYEHNESIGMFCHDLCKSNKMIIHECPNYFFHNGKEFVVTATWNGRKVILKSRNIKDESDPFGSENHHIIDLKHFIRGLNDIMSSTFAFSLEKYNAARFTSHDLIPWENNSSLSSLNRTALVNLWLLAQDNEFILSKVLSTSNYTKNSIVFPHIVGTCGQFYLVEYADEILDFSYILPSSATSLAKPYYQRLSIAIDLIDFLKRFESLNTGLQLCDVKFEHFGVFENENFTKRLLMIDSDMIYHKETAREAIAAIKDCNNDRDCDFVDCEGQCLTSDGSTYSFCQLNPLDNNLKRICRNMLFMGKFNVMGYKTQLGLLPGAVGMEDQLNEISKICLNDTFNMDDIDRLYKLLFNMRQKIINK